MSCTDEVFDKDRNLMRQYQGLSTSFEVPLRASSASQPDNQIMRR